MHGNAGKSKSKEEGVLKLSQVGAVSAPRGNAT